MSRAMVKDPILSKVAEDAATDTDTFEAYFIEHHCLQDLTRIYKSCWPNEILGPKKSTKSAREDLLNNFKRDSFKNMKKFARFFGLSSILLVSNEDALAKVWSESFKLSAKNLDEDQK